jgi:hypothetical protein
MQEQKTESAMEKRPGGDTVKWYFRKSFIVLAVCSVGPLALPLIWWRPNTKRGWKIGITIVVFALSWMLFRLTLETVREIPEYYKLLDRI